MSATEAITPGFMVIHGNRPDDLRSLVVEWMRRYPLRPLQNEVALVQSNGIAQWLKMALAQDPENGGCGIAAAIDVQLPGSFMWQLYRAVLGRDLIPEVSPLDKVPLTWRLMRLLPCLVLKPSFEPLARFLGDDTDMRKRYQLAQRLADLYDQYQVYRADWLEDWGNGAFQLRSARGEAKPLAEANRWQAALWQALLEDVGQEGMAQSRAGVHQRYMEVITTAQTPPADLPERVIVFGISSLPAQILHALAGLSRFTQVLLCVHNPCRHHWADIVADKDLLRREYRRQQRKSGMPLQVEAQDLHQHAHPLLAAWGKQGRDYISLLDEFDQPDSYRGAFSDGKIDLYSESDTPTLLSQLQNDILELRPLRETRELWPAVNPATDDSIRFHLAHSPQREVEVLHDQLLQRFSANPDLNPRDVIVMVPDINAYAPHIRAVFGQVPRDDRRHIPFTLNDQGQRGREPLLIALEHLLHLPDSRFAVGEVLDLLDVPALRARFGIPEQSLAILHGWIEGAGIRWGLDARQRTALGLPEGIEQNSWRFGLRRMLLGYAVGGEAGFDGIEPYDEVGGLDAALVGPLYALVDRLDHWYQTLASPAATQEWGERLQQLLVDFFVPEDEHAEYLLIQLDELRDQWLQACEHVELQDALPLTVVREAWLVGLDQGSLNQRFLAGSVNFCTLMPMRAIPFDVVCLLGMNDGDYPRAQPPLDFDLMAADYRPGDRSRREDDRYLLLEALLSARHQLYISWVGRSIRDNTERPPSVLIGQLRDHLASGWRLEGEESDSTELLHGLTLEHPLQPFSARYFEAGHEGLFSYAHEWQRVHEPVQALSVEQPLPAYTLDAPIAPDVLANFLRNPVKHFYTQRLKIYFEELQGALDEAEPFTLDGLQHYGLSRHLLDAAVLAGDSELNTVLQAHAQRLQAAGRLPMAGFGELLQAELIAPLPDLITRYQGLLVRWPQRLDSALPLHFEAQGIAVEGWLGGVHEGSDGSLLSVTLVANGINTRSGRKWPRLIETWVQHLIACAEGLPLHSAVVATDITLMLPPLEQSVASGHLAGLLQGWHLGMAQPLPVAARTAFAFLDAKDRDAGIKAAQLAYDGSDFGAAGERTRDMALARQYPDFNALTQDETFEGWVETLYQPLHAAPWADLSAQENSR
ncbi:exodeoxyribonuclease V subunit gamma [Pseudomonas sp. Marseille-Q5115]|uniref:exodeoxyribonuclease V subunit gamma n=1 Tax=Pseudomonas sp. Marseille-Q5115 TaxID=2866593 RepID=UPI001CE43316|nr:exodeoxyribonuclease V subunit gamma [Pseudomonas sp. Marseille-Q5115]